MIEEEVAMKLQLAEDFGNNDFRGQVPGGMATHAIGKDHDSAIVADREVGYERILLIVMTSSVER